MNKNNQPKIPQSKYNQSRQSQVQSLPEMHSLLDVMEDGAEYQSLLKYKAVNINHTEILRALAELAKITGRYTICYSSNFINSKIKEDSSINNTDELPFNEMINKVPPDVKEIDIVLITPGGSGEQVARFVDKLRPRFDTVRFILPYAAMSAGTIFVMSGDEIIMTSGSYIGPIDPQIMSKNGQLLPAQSLNVLISDIQERGEKKRLANQQPDWTDIVILRDIDPRAIGNTKMMSNFSIQLVKNYLQQYKFKNWDRHTSTGQPVTPEEKEQRALEIATNLCEHSFWKTHSRGITREVAWRDCKIKITHSESITNLDRAIKRMWAVLWFFFENSPLYKMFVSEHYLIMRNDLELLQKMQKP